MYLVSEIAKIINGKIVCTSTNDAPIQYLSTDSRTISFAAETLFFAIVSPTRNGHQYLYDAHQMGVRNFIVSKKVDNTKLLNSNIIQVSNTITALQKLAIAHRSKFNIDVIGITGSNGKTIVKEWLNQLLQPDFNIVRSPKSYNSQIGVAFSVWQIQQQHNLAIFEAGISEANQMAILQKIIAPTIGIITNIGEAHNEGFNNNLQQKVNEKIILFKNCKTIIFNSDNNLITNEIYKKYATANLVSWGHLETNTIQIIKQQQKQNSTALQLVYNKNKYNIHLPFIDAASIENAMHCIAVLFIKNYTEQQINIRLQQLQNVALRLEQKKGINNCIIINDTYSNDINSLQIALDYIQQFKQLQKTVILTDMQQVGQNAKYVYQKVANLLLQKKIKKLIAVGPVLRSFQHLFKNLTEIHFVEDTIALHHFIASHHFENEIILCKGARSFELEQVVILLQEKVHQTVLEIDIEKLIFNVKAHQQVLQPNTKIMAIVKAFGYGSGSIAIAQTLQQLGVAYLAVAYADEGVTLRKAGIYLPIMVMNVDTTAFEIILQYNLEPELFSITILQQFLQFAKNNALANYPVHIKLDTGMHRLGFENTDLQTICNILKNQNVIQVQSILSHLVGSEDASLDAFTKQQNTNFVNMAKAIEDTLGYNCIKHIANSSGIQRHPKLQHQMVRLGIGMYGVQKCKLGLQQVCILKTTIAQIKKVAKNDTVGYNRKGVLKKNAIIATIRIGYADGFSRNLGNGKGKVMVNNILVPTIGNICMDMTMIDITNVPNVQEGDFVTIFGNGITVQQVANWSNTIPYEILTNINERVKRVYLGT